MLRKLLATACFALLASNALAANAYISEFAALGRTSSGVATAQIATLPSNADQKLDYSGGAQTSAAFNSKTYFIRVHCDSGCSVSGTGSAATTSNMRIPADGVEYFAVLPGSTISVISSP